MAAYFKPFMRNFCDECEVPEGHAHLEGCFLAICNRCGKQVVSCHCPPAQKHAAPYIEWPQLCARCGETWPDFFQVTDAQWEETIQYDQRHCILCLQCFMLIRQVLGLSLDLWEEPREFLRAIETPQKVR